MRALVRLVCAPTVALLAFLSGALGATNAAAPEAIVVIYGDQHSAYDKLPQLVGTIDQLKADHPNTPLAVLVNGDSFEYGNVIARRTGGTLDFAGFRALADRAPTVLNLGNHEADLMGLNDVVRRLAEQGVAVISGNARDRASGQPFAPATTQLKLGRHTFTVVGMTTDALSTYRVAIRPDLDLANPVVWAKQQFPRLLKPDEPAIVLSHCGVRVDRELLGLVPAGSLYSGAHDHLRFGHRDGRTVYFHSGSWLEGVSIARLIENDRKLTWDVSFQSLDAAAPADAALVAKVKATYAEHLTAGETERVGHLPHPLAPAEAARFAVEAIRRTTGSDVAVVGGTTFGAGAPAGPLTRFAFDSWVRFDGGLMEGQLTGAQLLDLTRRANQGPDTPLSERAGENLVLAGPTHIDPAANYRLVTTDWIGRNRERYLGAGAPALKPVPGIRLKAAVLKQCQP